MFIALISCYTKVSCKSAVLLEADLCLRTYRTLLHSKLAALEHLSSCSMSNVNSPSLHITQLCRHMSSKTYEEGEWLYTQGSSADAVLVPLEGTASVWANPVTSSNRKRPNDGGYACAGVDLGVGCEMLVWVRIVNVWSWPGPHIYTLYVAVI